MGKKAKKPETNTDAANSNKETEKLDFNKSFTPEPDKNIPFPAPYKTEPRVYIEEEVYKEIQAHSKETTSVELCGVLIGEVRFDVSGNYLYICGSIRGEKAKNSGVNVSFTNETWDYIHEVREEKYPKYSIIGWYHTHPGFGIFLSDMDKFIQDYFFNQPYHVAMVVDPKASSNGIFAWQEGKICPLKHCWIGKEQLTLSIGTVGGEETYKEPKEDNPPTTVPLTSNKETDSSEKPSEDNFYKHFFYYFLCFNLAFLLVNFIHIKFASSAATVAAQAEAKDIIVSWAMDQNLIYQLGGLKAYINQNLEAIKGLPATYTIDINQFKTYSQYIDSSLTNITKESISRHNSAVEILKSVAYRNLSINEKSEQLSEKLKEAVSDSILIQLEPYLTSLSAQPINEGRIKDAKTMLENIISISSEQQKNIIKQKYPWILNN